MRRAWIACAALIAVASLSIAQVPSGRLELIGSSSPSASTHPERIGGPSEPTAITPIVVSCSPESTTSTTFVSTTCESTALADGVDYLVVGRAGVAGSDNAAQPHGLLEFGDSSDPGGELESIALTNLEISSVGGQGNGGSAHYSANQIAALALVTGDGSSTLFFSLKSSASDTAYIGAMEIVAVPLTGLTPGADYLVDQVIEGESADFQTGISNTPVAIGGVVSIDVPGPTQDWIVLASLMTFWSGAATATDGRTAAFEIDGVQLGATWLEEYESGFDFGHYTWQSIQTLTAGSHTFELLAANRNANAAMGAHRHKVILLRKAALVQALELVDTTGTASGLTNTAYDDTNSFLDQAITPGAADRWVLALASASGGNSTSQSTLMELRDKTAGASLATDSGEAQNDFGIDSGSDQIPTQLVGAKQLSAETTWSVRYRVSGASTGNVGRTPDGSSGIRSSLILMELAIP